MTKTNDIAEAIKALNIGGAPAARALITDMKIRDEHKKVEKLKTGGKTPGHGSVKDNGGARENSGRKPGGTADQKRLRKEIVQNHIKEDVEVLTKDGKTIKKPRLLIAMERLFALGTKGEGDANALDKWLNRAIGKPAQPIVGGDEDDEPVQLSVVGVDDMLKKIYGKDE